MGHPAFTLFSESKSPPYVAKSATLEWGTHIILFVNGVLQGERFALLRGSCIEVRGVLL
jgi:hypothetical protein